MAVKVVARLTQAPLPDATAPQYEYQEVGSAETRLLVWGHALCAALYWYRRPSKATTVAVSAASMAPIEIIKAGLVRSRLGCAHTDRGGPQGDDYPLEYDENGFPELPACLDRRQKKTRFSNAA